MIDLRTQKNVATLLPKVQDMALDFYVKAQKVLSGTGVDVRIISGTRSYAEQNDLYAIGRTKETSRRPVTNAKGGYSNHNFGIAFDIGLFRAAKYIPESALYAKLGPVGEAVGLEWGGRWKTFKDEPHYEYPTGLTLAQMRSRVAQGVSIV